MPLTVAVLHLGNHKRAFAIQDFDVCHVFLDRDDADIIRIDAGNIGQRADEIDGAQFFLLAAVEIDFGDVLVQFPVPCLFDDGAFLQFLSKVAL